MKNRIDRKITYNHTIGDRWNTTVSRAHTQSKLGYQHKRTRTVEAKTVVKVVTGVIIITQPRASESDFTVERPLRASSPEVPNCLPKHRRRVIWARAKNTATPAAPKACRRGCEPNKASFGFWGTDPHVEQTPRGIG
jgi:hypothetical protein